MYRMTNCTRESTTFWATWCVDKLEKSDYSFFFWPDQEDWIVNKWATRDREEEKLNLNLKIRYTCSSNDSHPMHFLLENDHWSIPMNPEMIREKNARTQAVFFLFSSCWELTRWHFNTKEYWNSLIYVRPVYNSSCEYKISKLDY